MGDIHLTREQFDRLWRAAKSVRNRGSDLCGLRDALREFGLTTPAVRLEGIMEALGEEASAIQRALIDAEDGAPDGPVPS